MFSLSQEPEEKPTKMTCIESAVLVFASRHVRSLRSDTSKLTKGSFSTDILSIPLVWKRFPIFKQVAFLSSFTGGCCCAVSLSYGIEDIHVYELPSFWIIDLY